MSRPPRMPRRPDIGQRIAERRQALSLSVIEAASKLGVSRAAIYNWESGTAITVDHLFALARLLLVSPGWLLTGEASPSPLALRIADLPPALQHEADRFIAVLERAAADVPFAWDAPIDPSRRSDLRTYLQRLDPTAAVPV